MNIPVVRKILSRNQQDAEQNRAWFDARGIVCVNLLGGAGCGKTALLEAALPRLADSRVVVFEGDPATTQDAERLAALQIPVVQLITDGSCHLTASLVADGLEQVELRTRDLLMIENVGNPICPANFDLGEHVRVAVLSVTEGDDKPTKYTRLFTDVAAVVITKGDLLGQVSFDMNRVIRDIHRVSPAARVFTTSARTGEEIAPFAEWLRSVISAPKLPAEQPT